MNYSGLKEYDIANGDGVRLSLYVSGCENKCPGCFNPETWDPSYGKPFTEETIKYIIDYLKKAHVSGLSILGGDPMLRSNQKIIADLVKKVRECASDKTIWLWTGYTYEELRKEDAVCHTEFTDVILQNIDILVDGRFIEKLKLPNGLKYKGSSNQRVLRLVKGEIVAVSE